MIYWHKEKRHKIQTVIQEFKIVVFEAKQLMEIKNIYHYKMKTSSLITKFNYFIIGREQNLNMARS